MVKKTVLSLNEGDIVEILAQYFGVTYEDIKINLIYNEYGQDYVEAEVSNPKNNY